MKIPEPLFKLINLVVALLLKSPLHRFWSDSLVVIRFTGRKTGKLYTTPVRYLKKGDVVQCFTSKTGSWWRNIAASGEATLLLRGNQLPFKADVVTEESGRVREALLDCLDRYPQDAVYHNIRMGPGGKPLDQDLQRELPNVVLLVFTPKRD
ncbi:MAG: nitroreductase family deazaflavin-dependent oxidoreductase [Candidatus Azotimanducaceae bacterium WSBS_2022_MAG_OTU7]